MKIGIVGFSGSGKTTLFNALTGQDIPVGFGNKVNLGTIKVPDARIDRLVEIDNPKKITFTEIIFADVPGGKGSTSLDTQTLGKIREMDALAQVVRGFDEGAGTPEPVNEILGFESELILSDMSVIEKRLERLRKDRSDMKLLDVLERCGAHIESEQPLRTLELTELEKKSLSGFTFLSLKPIMFVLSLPEGADATTLPADVQKLADERNLAIVPICTAIEAEIASLDRDDQIEFLKDLGLEEPASARFIKTAYSLLNLITFLTHGPDECRAWSIRKGSNAQEAAGAIHSDLARGFIRAEVISFADFNKYGSEAACRDNGAFRIEGKEYIVQDGDICHIRFNV
ncbi:MAG: redox-regulated ATPase YchF [Deltaproteobacteria bacterium]|nr:redox-regulated ATPase YchF [Deltaproteobacteria bacterium]MBN2673400.1 redox-regulated ATPase YchF [Deltaproteobacteria bacterium]